jgi:hypothetical protein
VKSRNDVIKRSPGFSLREWKCKDTNVGQKYNRAITTVTADQFPAVQKLHLTGLPCTVGHMDTQFREVQNSTCPGLSETLILHKPKSVYATLASLCNPECVYSAVRTKHLNTILVKFRLSCYCMLLMQPSRFNLSKLIPPLQRTESER